MQGKIFGDLGKLLGNGTFGNGPIAKALANITGSAAMGSTSNSAAINNTASTAKVSDTATNMVRANL